MKKIISMLVIAATLSACTPAEKQDAANIQADINAITPAAAEGVDLILIGTGNAPAAAINNTLLPALKAAQKAILNQLDSPEIKK